LLLGAIAVLVAGIGVWRVQARAAVVPQAPVGTVTRGDLDITVEGSGTVQPARSVNLPFQSPGQVREVLVKAGDHVKAGQALARLDNRNLELQVQQAAANLKEAQAKLDVARKGAATPEDLQQGQAQIQAAEAALEKARAGNSTPADIKNAEAGLAAAQARLQETIQGNATPADIAAAQAQVRSAQANLQKVQIGTVTPADIAAAQAQIRGALANLQKVQTGKATAAEIAIAQAQVDQAKANLAKLQQGPSKAEIAAAQAQVDLANANLAKVKQGGTQTDIAIARDAVAQAQAQLDKAHQGGSPAEVAQAQAQLEQIRATVAKLTAPSTQSDISTAEAGVAQARAQLDAARLDLDHATLVAPFDGVVSAVGVVPGAVATAQTSAVTVDDRSSLHIDVNMSESDVARVETGQPVKLTFDAIPGAVVAGVVDSIAPTATVQQNVVTYLVQVRFDPASTPVKLGMSATADITVQRVKNAVLVPNRAIQTQGRDRSVRVLYGNRQVPVVVNVETGASNGTLTEITGCTDTNGQCLREGDRLALNATTAPTRNPQTGTGGSRGAGAGIFGGR
jgi:HlyD family secretion protein